MNRTLYLFLQFLRRDIYEYSKKIKAYLFNFGILRPIIFGFSFAYIQSNVMFESNQIKICTNFLVGSSIIILMVLSFTLAIRLLLDLEKHKFVEYQISILSPRLVILEKILFASLFTFIIVSPFFPISKLILRHHIDTTHANWPQLFLILYLGSLCCSAYHYLASCILKDSSRFSSFWLRINLPLLIFGGLWVPFFLIKQFSPILSTINYLNPITYITEGLRRAIMTDTHFLPVWICAIGLLVLSIIFTLLTFYFFKKRVDHI